MWSLHPSPVLLNIGFGQNGNACEVEEGMRRLGRKSGAVHALAIKGEVLIRVSKQFPEALELQSFHLGLGKKLAPVELFKVSGVCRMIAAHPGRKNEVANHPGGCGSQRGRLTLHACTPARPTGPAPWTPTSESLPCSATRSSPLATKPAAAVNPAKKYQVSRPRLCDE